MKENSPASLCEKAAVRIEGWLCKDRENLLQSSPPKPQGFPKKHRCNPVKSPRVPSQIQRLSLQGYNFAKKKKESKARHVIKASPSKSLHFSLGERDYQQQNSLNSDRVAQHSLKEHFIASKKLKCLAKLKPTGPKQHQVVPISLESPKNQPSDPYLQEWGKRHEERHFQIERVIKYLTD